MDSPSNLSLRPELSAERLNRECVCINGHRQGSRDPTSPPIHSAPPYRVARGEAHRLNPTRLFVDRVNSTSTRSS